MRNQVSGIKQYFDQTASRFDLIYSAQKPWHQRVLDAAFRKTVNQRYELIMAQLPDLSGRTVLDVGTGSGRYAVELAARGASVTGVDFASQMLALAQEAAQHQGVAERCRWLQGDFLQLKDLDSQYDVSLAIGFLDYIREPLPILQRMFALTKASCYLSFPKRWTLRTAPRKIRLGMNGCYVRFYSRREVEALLRSSARKPVSTEIASVSRDYLVTVRFA
jgi:ubiquinone/menaquinone biosynthesis C-methylase UbiE